MRWFVAIVSVQRLCPTVGLPGPLVSAKAMDSPLGEIAAYTTLSVFGMRVIFNSLAGARRRLPRRLMPKGKLIPMSAKLVKITAAAVLWRLMLLTTYSKVELVVTTEASAVVCAEPAAGADVRARGSTQAD